MRLKIDTLEGAAFLPAAIRVQNASSLHPEDLADLKLVQNAHLSPPEARRKDPHKTKAGVPQGASALYQQVILVFKNQG